MTIKKGTRINRYLSQCGLGSRRGVESLILEGRIRVNNSVISELSTIIFPESDIIEFDNIRVYPEKNNYYLIINKPRGYITSVKDDRKRPIVMDLIPEKYKAAGIFPVGRLDKDTEGLLLLTNDGDLAYRLTHPKFGIPKEYFVEINRSLADFIKLKIERGFVLEGRKTNPTKITLLDTQGKKLMITLTEGKKRQIRLSFQNFGFRVKRIKRLSFGPLKLKNINSGDFRLLKPGEIKSLKKLAHPDTQNNIGKK